MSVASVRGIELAYTDVGTGLPPVVLLHGYPFNRSMWDGQVRELSGRWRVIAPDLRGHGESGAGDGAAVTTMEELAEDVAALLDALRLERVVLGGLSMGGYVALAFYRRFRERVRALVLADTRATPDTEEARRGREESAQKILSAGMKPVADAMLPKLLAPATLENNAEVAARVRGMMERTKPEGAVAALRGMAARRDQTELLAEIDVPTLVIVGSLDTLTPPRDAESLRARVRGSRLVVIEGAAHVSNVERPAEFNRALAEFLETLEP
ncbi:MAG TPA: alpha/beta fold hydrolase [Pyrinomonadaceae bacterium]|nr:alpha/beta fold hydrolase [Pyrinomonadaceae bacterium]